MTRAYLLSTLSSSSSIGGLVMPSGEADVPATCSPSGLHDCDCGPGYQSGGPHELRESFGHLVDRRVDEGLVELVLRGELDLGGVEPTPDHLGVLGATPPQPALQFLPRRW